MVNFKLLLLQEWIEDDLDNIAFIVLSNKVFHRIRENNSRDQNLIDLCRLILYEHGEHLRYLKQRIENDRGKIKELS